MISLQQMQYIIALCDEGQFQRASEVCFVTQPTLSMQVKKAEDALGFLLFDRSRQPLELTPFGEKLVPILREVLSESAKINTVTQQMKGNYVERIRLGIIPTIATYMVPDLFPQWLEKLQNIQLSIVEMKTEDLIVALDKKELDGIIMAGPFTDVRFTTQKLYTEEIKAYIPNESRTSVVVNDLKELHPWLLSSGNCLRNQMIQLCQIKDEANDNQWNYEGGNIDLLIKMTEQYGGYTLVPEFFHTSTEQKPFLKPIVSAQNELYPARDVIAIYPNRSLKEKSINQLIREIQLKYNTNQKKFDVLGWK
jgi:LysR family hydrogen peroxide-inducible transcriptional activator